MNSMLPKKEKDTHKCYTYTVSLAASPYFYPTQENYGASGKTNTVYCTHGKHNTIQILYSVYGETLCLAHTSKGTQNQYLLSEVLTTWVGLCIHRDGMRSNRNCGGLSMVQCT